MCTVCCNFLVCPISLQCGHTFCMRCIFQLTNDLCPCCRYDFGDKDGFGTNKALESLLRLCVPNYSDLQLESDEFIQMHKLSRELLKSYNFRNNKRKLLDIIRDNSYYIELAELKKEYLVYKQTATEKATNKTTNTIVIQHATPAPPADTIETLVDAKTAHEAPALHTDDTDIELYFIIDNDSELIILNLEGKDIVILANDTDNLVGLFSKYSSYLQNNLDIVLQILSTSNHDTATLLQSAYLRSCVHVKPNYCMKKGSVYVEWLKKITETIPKKNKTKKFQHDTDDAEDSG